MKWPFCARARYSNPSVRVEGGTQARRGSRNRVTIASSSTYAGDKVPGPKTSPRAPIVVTDRNTNKLHWKRDTRLPPLKYPALVLHHSSASKIAAVQPPPAPGAPTVGCGQRCPAATQGQSSWKISSNPADRKGGKGTHILIPTLCTSQVTISVQLQATQLKVETEVCSCINSKTWISAGGRPELPFCTCHSAPVKNPPSQYLRGR